MPTHTEFPYFIRIFVKNTGFMIYIVRIFMRRNYSKISKNNLLFIPVFGSITFGEPVLYSFACICFPRSIGPNELRSDYFYSYRRIWLQLAVWRFRSSTRISRSLSLLPKWAGLCLYPIKIIAYDTHAAWCWR